MIEIKLAWRATTALMKFLGLAGAWFMTGFVIILGRRKYQRLLEERARRLGKDR